MNSIPPSLMFSLNRVHLIGYQTQPVNVRQTPNGTSVTDLNLVVPHTFTAENGEPLTSKGFFTVTLWGPMAEVAGQYVRPGAQVFIGGRLQTDSWEDEQSGEKRSKTKVVALDMILLDSKDGQQQPPENAPTLTNVVNRADVIGNVSRDPELRTTTNGRQVLTLGIASNERWKDKSSGEQRERTEFHNVVVWGDLAEEVSRCVRKGNRVFASGRVQTRSWETQNGSKRTTTEIIADQVSLLGVRNSVAEEAVQSDAAGQTGAAAAAVASAQPQQPAQDQPQDSAQYDAEAQAVSAAPDVEHSSEIKAEDLPF